MRIDPSSSTPFAKVCIMYSTFDLKNSNCGLNCYGSGNVGEAVSVTIAGVTIWSTTIFAVRNLLKMLFAYKGF